MWEDNCWIVVCSHQVKSFSFLLWPPKLAADLLNQNHQYFCTKPRDYILKWDTELPLDSVQFSSTEHLIVFLLIVLFLSTTLLVQSLLNLQQHKVKTYYLKLALHKMATTGKFSNKLGNKLPFIAAKGLDMLLLNRKKTEYSSYIRPLIK